MVEQGDIIRVDGIRQTALVVSRDLYNASGRVIVCPIVSEDPGVTLAYPIDQGRYVLCDSPRQLDVDARGFSVKGRVSLAHLINIVDRVQSLFDYY